MDSVPTAKASSDCRDPDTARAGAGLLRAAGVVSVGVMGSRVLGLVREMVLAYFFRTSGGLDAFYAAFRIPNLFRDMFGEGALSKAFVATFTEVEQKDGKKAGLRLANQVLNVVLVVVGGVALLGIVFADRIVALMFFGEGFDIPLPAGESFGFASKRELTVYLTRIMFPFILLASLAALVMGFLNARGKFFVPALASSFFNLGSIIVGIAGYFLAPRFGLHPTVGMAVGVIAGGACQLLWQIPSLFAQGYRFRPTLAFRDPRVLKVMRLFGPGALVAATVQINVFVNSLFASMGSGWLSWISQAFRLVHLPIGLIGVAVSVATLPALSRCLAAGDREGFRGTFASATRLVILLTVPASVGLIVLARPIVRLIYERGRSESFDTEQVAAALIFYSLGLTSYAAVKIVTDGFYALQDLKAPLVISLVSMAANAALNYWFVAHLGMDHRGLALATSCTMTLSFMCLWFMLRRRSGLANLGEGATAVLFGKVTFASLIMGVFAVYTQRGIEGWLGHESLLAQIFQIGAAITVALIVLYVALKILRVRELDQAIRALLPAGWGRR